MSQKIKIVFLTILTLIVINCGSVFASSLTGEQVEEIMSIISGNEIVLGTNIKNKIKEFSEKYAFASLSYNNNYSIYFSNKQPEMLINNNYLQIHDFGGNSIEISAHLPNDLRYYDSSGHYERLDSSRKYIFLPDGAINNTDNSNYDFYPGWQSREIISLYKKPYFEFSANKIGTTNLENFEEKIPCFYPKSFESHSNSYASFKEIGKLYIDENYEISQLYTSVPDINIYNLTQTESWTYKNYLIFTDNIIVNGYKIYTINIDLNYIKTPYIYIMKLKSLDNELANDISIDFVLLTQTTEGGIVVESGDTEVSGDLTKDETTLGDIQNTIENIFQEPNEEELKQEQENNINEIKNQITDDLENNKVFSALTTAEQGLIELLEGEPRRI